MCSVIFGRNSPDFNCQMLSFFSRELRSELYRTSGWQGVWSHYLKAGSQDSPDRFVVWALIFLNRKKEAIDRLEELEARQDSWIIILEDPMFDSLRQESRFKALMKRVGYPPSMWN
jgi:hypothetical protein